MAATEVKKSWAREVSVTVAGSVIVFFIQNYMGLKDKPSDAAPAPLAAPAPPATTPATPKGEALRHLDCGKESARAGHHALAIAHFSAALRLAPALAEGYSRRAWSHLHLGQFECAAGDYGALLRLDPASSHAYVNRAWVYCQLGHYEHAVQDCEQALQLDPSLKQAQGVRDWARERLRPPGAGVR